MKNKLVFLFLFANLIVCQQTPVSQLKMKKILVDAGIVNEQNLCDPCILTTALFAAEFVCLGSDIPKACAIGAGISSVFCYCCAPFDYWLHSNFFYARIIRKIDPKIKKWVFGVPELNNSRAIAERHMYPIKNPNNLPSKLKKIS